MPCNGCEKIIAQVAEDPRDEEEIIKDVNVFYWHSNSNLFLWVHNKTHGLQFFNQTDS